jgi:hypothetical protein
MGPKRDYDTRMRVRAAMCWRARWLMYYAILGTKVSNRGQCVSRPRVCARV